MSSGRQSGAGVPTDQRREGGPLRRVWGGPWIADIVAGSWTVRKANETMKTLHKIGNLIDYTAGSAVACGAVLVMGNLLGIAVNAIAASAVGPVLISGAIKTTAKNASSAWTIGCDVFWDAGNEEWTTVASGNTRGGVAFAAAGSSATTGYVLLNAHNASLQTNEIGDEAVTVAKMAAGGLDNVIADPGDGAAIPVTKSGSIAITTAAAETNTLAIPTFAGQQLSLICDVYSVGDRVVTVEGTVNQAGNNTLTFGAAADHIVLVGAQVAGALVWRVQANDGVGLTTA